MSAVFGVRANLLCAAACALAAPAAANPPSAYDRMLVFGDSISDSGTYADRAPAGAGRFTTNPDPVWVEVIAAGLSLDLAPAVAGGTNHAEGGARVSQPRPGAPGDLTRRPVTDQIDDFLAAGGAFGPGDLVIVQGGGNDVFATQLNGPSFTEADLAVLDQAALDLAAQVERIAGGGAGAVVTVSVPRFEVFNSRYRTALADAGANVLYVDIAGLVAEIETNPSEFGIVNVTDRACRGRVVESFTCLPQDYVVPDANRTYLFADGVHFTGVVHEIEAGAVLAALRAPTQVGQLPFAGEAVLDTAHEGLRATVGRAPVAAAGQWMMFGWVEGRRLEVDPGARAAGLDGDAAGATVGAAYGLGRDMSLGLAVTWTDADGDFGQESGRFRLTATALTAFGRVQAGPVDILAEASIGDLDFDDVSRRVELGPAERIESGDTHGRVWAAGVEVGAPLPVGPLDVRPLVGLRYTRTEVEAYAEAGDRSTQITYGDQVLERLTGEIGVEAAWPAIGGGRFSPFVRVSYAADLLDEDREISITPHGAPIPYASPLDGGGEDAWIYAAGVAAEVQPGLMAVADVSGVARGDVEATVLRIGVRGVF